MVSITNQRKEEISKSLQEAASSGADLAEKIRGAEDTLAKKLIVAPDAGTVTDIKFVTPGSSIGAGQPILASAEAHGPSALPPRVLPPTDPAREGGAQP